MKPLHRARVRRFKTLIMGALLVILTDKSVLVFLFALAAYDSTRSPPSERLEQAKTVDLTLC